MNEKKLRYKNYEIYLSQKISHNTSINQKQKLKQLAWLKVWFHINKLFNS